MGQHDIDPEALPYAVERPTRGQGAERAQVRGSSDLPRKDPIDAEAFFKLDLRVGRVTAVEDFPEARRPAWKLAVDFGPLLGTLHTSAQIKNYDHDALLGRLVVGAVNLGDKRIAGFVSQFLVLGALQPDGTVLLLEVPEGAEPGAPVA